MSRISWLFCGSKSFTTYCVTLKNVPIFYSAPCLLFEKIAPWKKNVAPQGNSPNAADWPRPSSWSSFVPKLRGRHITSCARASSLRALFANDHPTGRHRKSWYRTSSTRLLQLVVILPVCSLFAHDNMSGQCSFRRVRNICHRWTISMVTQSATHRCLCFDRALGL